jgi:hypothetical protein
VARKAFALGGDSTWLKAKGQVDYNTQSQKARAWRWHSGG